MKLTKNSWHYNAYLFLTGKTPNNNFCDYFWELLFNLIFFIPNLPFYLTTLGYSKVEKSYNSKWERNGFIRISKTYTEKLQANNKIPLYGKLFASIAISLILWILGYFLIYETLKLISVISLIILAALLIVGVVYYFTTSSTPGRIADNIIEFFSMIKEAFIAFKNNYCPKIDWADKN